MGRGRECLRRLLLFFVIENAKGARNVSSAPCLFESKFDRAACDVLRGPPDDECFCGVPVLFFD